MIRLYAYAAIALAIGGLLLRDHIVTKQRNAAVARANVAEASLTAERENTRKANEASIKYQADLTALRAARADAPLPSVVCKRTRSVPAASAATGSDAARPADDAGENAGDRVEHDIGPQLDDFATACEANLIQLTRLQEWVRGR